MKKTFGFLVLVGVLSFSFNAQSDSPVVKGHRPEINRTTGEVRFVEEVERWDSNLSKEEKDAIDNAVANPGVEYPMDSKVTQLERPSFFSVVTTTRDTKFVVYDGNKVKLLNKTVEKSSKEQFSWYVVFCLVAWILLLISNFFMMKGKKGVAAAFASAFTTVLITAFTFATATTTFAALAVAVTAAFAALTLTFALTAAVAVTVTAAVIAAVAVTVTTNQKAYWISTAICYLALLFLLGYGWIF